MYIPPAFRQTDRADLIECIRQNSFGLLVSQLEGGPFATHLPLLVDAEAPPNGQLLGHMARGNPQWKELEAREVLAVFSGPHAYISPSWYEAENMVPTWNYVAVHVYGRCELETDEAALARILKLYLATYEDQMPRPWSMDERQPFFRKLMQGVVGFRIAIERIEGKWKLGQNHPAERRHNAARHLAERGDAASRAVARLMLDTK